MKTERNSYRLPAEWEQQWGIQLTWPHAETDWKPYLDDITHTYEELARAITEREELLIVVPKTSFLPENIRENRRVHIVECDTNDTWARDHGPITLIRKKENEGDVKGESGNMLLLDFRFNGWGEKFSADKDNLITRSVVKGDSLDIPFTYEDHDDFVLEGGSIESDGCGTVFTTSQCLLAPHRNQPLSKDDIEQQLKERLNADRVVWLDHGNLTGDDTDGHIDTIVRCAPCNTMLYVQSRDAEDPQHEDFTALELQLKALRTVSGDPYRLLPLPMPRPIFDEVNDPMSNGEERLPATYANFLVLNGAVLVPTYSQEDLDREAMNIIKEAFPDREIIGIDARTIIRQHGSIHCLTMQIPAV